MLKEVVRSRKSKETEESWKKSKEVESSPKNLKGVKRRREISK